MNALYPCRFCMATYRTSAQLGGHTHAAHPEHKRALPKMLRTTIVRKRRPSLKRPTDAWPGRP